MIVYHEMILQGRLFLGLGRLSRGQQPLRVARLNLKKKGPDTTTTEHASARLMTFDSTSEERLSQYTFWKERYKNLKSSTTFDWFVDSSLVLENIDTHLTDLYKNSSLPLLRYLELGCGNSDLPVSVYRESLIPVHVFAMDYVTSASQQQYDCAMDTSPKNSKSCFQGICGDVMKMPFKSDQFNIAVDKGTMDALLKNKEKGKVNCSVMLSEVMRSLAPGGRYIQISDEDPDSRLDFLQDVTRWCEGLSQSDEHSIVDNVLFQDSQNPSRNISYVNQREADKDSDHCLQSFQDIREDVKMSIKQNEILYKSASAPVASKNNLMCSSWGFKVITDEECNKEYFMYWIEKT